MYIEVVLCNYKCWSWFHLWISWDFGDFWVLVSKHEKCQKQVGEHWPKNSCVLNVSWIIGNCNICIDWVCLGQMRWHEAKWCCKIANEFYFPTKDSFVWKFVLLCCQSVWKEINKEKCVNWFIFCEERMKSVRWIKIDHFFAVPVTAPNKRQI